MFSKNYNNISHCHLIGIPRKTHMLCVCAHYLQPFALSHTLCSFLFPFTSSLFLSLLPSPTFREECFREGTHQIILHLPGAYAEMCVCVLGGGGVGGHR